jgi:hypothetical protein
MPSPLKGGPVYGNSFAAQGRIRCELYIDYLDAGRVDQVYEFLLAHRGEIEDKYGGPLEWAALPSNRASRIADYSVGDVVNLDQHDAYIDWFFDTGTRLRNALAEPLAMWITQGPDGVGSGNLSYEE